MDEEFCLRYIIESKSIYHGTKQSEPVQLLDMINIAICTVYVHEYLIFNGGNPRVLPSLSFLQTSAEPDM